MTNAFSTDNRILAKQHQTAMERLGDLESDCKKLLEEMKFMRDSVNNVLGSVFQRLGTSEQKLSALNELMRATVDLLGSGPIDERIQVNRKQDMVDRMKKDKAQLEMLVSQGLVLPAAKIGPKSITEGVEKFPDGTPKDPGYVQVFVEGLSEELRSLLLDKVVGDQVVLPNNEGSFTVESVFDPKDPPKEEPTQATQE